MVQLRHTKDAIRHHFVPVRNVANPASTKEKPHSPAQGTRVADVRAIWHKRQEMQPEIHLSAATNRDHSRHKGQFLAAEHRKIGGPHAPRAAPFAEHLGRQRGIVECDDFARQIRFQGEQTAQNRRRNIKVEPLPFGLA